MLGNWSMVMQIFWGALLQLSGVFHKHAKITLKSWKNIKVGNKMDKKYMSKFLKACRPIAIGERGLFLVKQTTVLKFFRAIVKGTFRALLTLGKK